MEEVGKYLIGSELTREDISKLWSTEDLLVRDERGLLVWHHRMNHFSFKSLIRLSKRRIIKRKLIKIRKLPPCVACIFRKSHKRPWRTKCKQSSGSIRKSLEARPGSMTSIYQMFSTKPGIITQVTGALTHARLCSANVFMDYYSEY